MGNSLPEKIMVYGREIKCPDLYLGFFEPSLQEGEPSFNYKELSPTDFEEMATKYDLAEFVHRVTATQRYTKFFLDAYKKENDHLQETEEFQGTVSGLERTLEFTDTILKTLRKRMN